jgi:manganese/iron transport system permease protein
VQTAIVGAVCIVVIAALHKELVARAFDPRHAEALGYDVRLLDLALDVCVALLVVAAVRAVGTVLVIAFVVTPAATAQLVSRRVLPMMAVAAAIGIGIGWLALGVSFDASVRHGARLPAGATIVVGYTLAFLAVAGAVAIGRAVTRRRAVPAVR